MYIDGAEKNKQISRAYLLLGKSRYFNGKYLQALDAFNYVIRNMSNSKNSKIAELWKAKVFIEIGQNNSCLLYTSPSPRDLSTSRMPSSA